MTRSTRLPRAAVLTAALASAAALVLSGCAAGQISQTADQVAAIDGANGTVGNIGVRNALLATASSDTGYAKGSDAEMTLMVSNNGVTGDTLTKVSSTAAGSTTITDAQASGAALPAQTLVPVKVTLKALTADIPYGFSVPVTFSFQNAGQVTVNVPIEIPAERSSDRSSVNIQPAEPTPLWETGVEAEH